MDGYVLLDLSVRDRYWYAWNLVHIWYVTRYAVPIAAVLCLGAAAALYISLICAAGRRPGREDVIKNRGVDRIPFDVVLILVSVAVGLFFAWIIKMLWDKIRHLEHNGAYKIEDAVGLTATVYIPIPPARSGTGKVQISIGGSVQELNAVSDSTDKLKTGQLVAVDSVINSSTLLVKPC